VVTAYFHLKNTLSKKGKGEKVEPRLVPGQRYVVEEDVPGQRYVLEDNVPKTELKISVSQVLITSVCRLSPREYR
ncbi:hypothetical protein BgiMline_033712, partial [Biomphalaria glabrata]